MKRYALHIMPLAALLVLGGCATPPPIPDHVSVDPAIIAPVAPPEPGAIFQAGRQLALFEDLRARRVGDIVTINLVERTDAKKSSSATAGRSTSASLGSPTVFGGEVTKKGVPILSGGMEAGVNFDGSAGAAQSNRLDGQITVTVVERLPNGNLLVRGEKWLQLTQDSEYVRVIGIVRPSDIDASNSVPSYKVAEARITYAGKGTADHATKPGLLARFFMSPFSGQ